MAHGGYLVRVWRVTWKLALIVVIAGAVVRGLKIGQAVITAADGDNSKLTDGRAIQR